MVFDSVGLYGIGMITDDCIADASGTSMMAL